MPLATHLVSRPRLHARLTAGLRSSCTLIAAPAGWGKTLLAGSWLAEGGAGRAAAWVSLGPAEDDVQALWTAVATALVPVVGERAAADLRQVVTDDNVETLPGRVATILAGDGTPIVLVLDNLHEVTSLAAHESLLRLVRRPTAGAAVRGHDTTGSAVAVGPAPPRWGDQRGPGRRAIAFRADETAALLGQLGIDLDDTHVGRLVERTDGWAAGLRLAALQLQGDADPAEFVDAFSGDDHAVAAYLLTEVIDRQTPELLDFLARVSFVDLVSADLADALTGARTGADTLAELAASNLFVHAVGPGGRWYRLHRLIADVLRTRITDPRTIRDIHRRAAEWYRRHSLPLDAIRLRPARRPVATRRGGPRRPRASGLVIRGSARELDVLLSAVPRDALLGHPELATTLAAARIMSRLGPAR